jgi:hypothetical protein
MADRGHRNLTQIFLPSTWVTGFFNIPSEVLNITLNRETFVKANFGATGVVLVVLLVVLGAPQLIDAFIYLRRHLVLPHDRVFSLAGRHATAAKSDNDCEGGRVTQEDD